MPIFLGCSEWNTFYCVQLLVREGFEPTKAYATGYLLSRILSQAHASILVRGVSCPFGLIPAHEMSVRRLYWVSGTPAAKPKPILADALKHKPRSTSRDNSRLASRTSSATSSFNKIHGSNPGSTENRSF